MQQWREKLIGDRKFYRRLFRIAVPMMIQMGITNFASMLDNIMVGKIGTEQMTGVAIANQLVFVYNLLVFGAVSGPGIFTAQFFGQRNHEGIRYTVRFKLICCGIITVLGLIVMGSSGEPLIRMYLHQEGSTGSIADTLVYGLDYLHIVMLSFIPFAFVQAYAGTLKETGETLLPMKAGLISVLVNLYMVNLVCLHWGRAGRRSELWPPESWKCLLSLCGHTGKRSVTRLLSDCTADCIFRRSLYGKYLLKDFLFFSTRGCGRPAWPCSCSATQCAGWMSWRR